MSWFILKHIFSTLLAIVNVRRLSGQEKDLEILVLRQQLSILQRKLNHPIKPSKTEKLTLAVLTTKFKQTTRQTANQLRDVIRIFEPETVLRWQSFPALSGIGKWFVENGPIPTKSRVDDHRSARKLKA